MRIKEVKFKNYRQYKQLTFQFKKSEFLNNDMHIIIASNGVGKSNFLNAITWCLYEEESHLQDKYKALPIVNLDTLSEMQNNDKVTVSVELTLEIDGKQHKIVRENEYIKSELFPDGIKRNSSVLSYITYGYDPSFGYNRPIIATDENAKQFVNKIFPKGISEYFFFDNEQMNNYFTANAGGTIQRAINTITKIDLVQKVIERLKNLLNDYRVDFGHSNTKIKDLQTALKNAEEKFVSEKNEYDETLTQIKIVEEKLSSLSEDIKGAENLKLLEFERETKKNREHELKSSLYDLEIQIDNFIVRYYTLINCYSSFNKILKIIDEKGKKKQLPPDISKSIIEESIKKCECQLCQNKLSDIHYEIVKKQLDSFVLSSPAYTTLLTVKSKVLELKNETKLFLNKKEKLLQKQDEIQKEIDTIRERIIKIDNDMKSIPNKDELRKKLEKRDMLEDEKIKLYSSKGTISSRVKMYEDEYNKATKMFDFEVAKQNKNNEKSKKYEATKKLLSYLEASEQELIKEIRDEISTETYKQFIDLIWKENTYSEIKIDESYNVDLIHKRGYSAIGSTSAAERALLALSFTNAIHKVSKFESPLVIDSPVGRVSDDNRRRFAEALAEISKNKQIIMLFTPDEYSKDISDIFDNVAIKSKASMNDGEEITTIKGV